MPTNPTWEETTDIVQAPSWDETTSEKEINIPKPQPWELSPTGQKPYLGQFSGGPFSPYEELNREEAANIFKSLVEPPVAIPRFEGETTAGKIAAGVGNVAGGIYNMVASPVGALTMPLAATKLGGPIIKGVFGGLAAKTAGEQLGEASVTGDVQQYTEGLLNAALAPGMALPGKFGYVEPEKVRLAKEVARELGRSEPTVETIPPEAIRQLGIRVPEGPFAQPGVPELADAALNERNQLVRLAGAQEEGALMDLRRAIEPAQIIQEQLARKPLQAEAGQTIVRPNISGLAVEPGFRRTASDVLLERTQPKPVEPPTPVKVNLPEEIKVEPKPEVAAEPILPETKPEPTPAPVPVAEPKVEVSPVASGIPENIQRLQRDLARATEDYDQVFRQVERSRNDPRAGYAGFSVYDDPYVQNALKARKKAENALAKAIKAQRKAEKISKPTPTAEPAKAQTQPSAVTEAKPSGGEGKVAATESKGVLTRKIWNQDMLTALDEARKEHGIIERTYSPESEFLKSKKMVLRTWLMNRLNIGPQNAVKEIDNLIRSKPTLIQDLMDGKRVSGSKVTDAYIPNSTMLNLGYEKVGRYWERPTPTAQTVAEPKKGIVSGGAVEAWADNVIKEGKKRMGAGLDPELLAAHAVKGAALLERGIRDFAQWSKQMITLYGESLRPHLKTIWDQANAAISEVSTASKTAISRVKPAEPTTWLVNALSKVENSPIDAGKSILHFGSGKDSFTTHLLGSKGAKVVEYDPTYAPNRSVLNRKFDTVVSNFVLNTLPKKVRDSSAYPDLVKAIGDGGTGYISVRAAGDRSIRGIPEGDGVRTSKGTFQKGYTKQDFESELKQHFQNVEIVRGSDNSSSLTAKVSNIAPQAVTKGIVTGRAIEKWADETLRGGATHAGPDVIAAYLVKGVALIERGIINFAEWSAKMIAAHGPEIKPHLRDLFQAAQDTIKRTPPVEVSPLKSAREIVEQRIAQSKPVATTEPIVAQPTSAIVPPPATTASKQLPQVTLDDIYKIFEPEPKKSTPLKTRGINILEAFRTGFSSKFRPINKLAEEITKAYGGTRKDIAGIFEQLKGSSGKGEADIYRFNRDVSSLVKGNEKDFNAYMFLNRSLDRLRQDMKDIQTALAGGNVATLNRRAVAQYTIPQLEAKLALLEQNLGPEKLATFQEAATKYQQYMDQALKLQVDSGRMSQKVYDAIKSGNQFYAPFKVMKYLEESMKPEGTGRKIDTVADYTKAMEGIEDSNFKLGDMLGAARQSLLVSRILADKAIAMRNIADLAKVDTQQLFIKPLKSGEDVPLGMQAVNVFENGTKVRYATRPEVAEALEIYGNTGGGIVSSVLRMFSVPFKLGATALNVPFQLSNLMADVPRQALVSKYGIRGVNDLVRYPLDLVHALYSSLEGDILHRDNKLFLDFLDSGAAATTVQEHLTPKALRYRDPSTMSKAKRVALNILYSPAEFSTAIEQVSKILGVKRAMRFEGVKSGAELAKQVPEAITEIRRFSGSPDFGRQGKFVEQAKLNLLYMFLNARIQGAVADLGRLTGRDGAKQAAITWFRVGSAVGLPTAYLYSLNNSPEFKADYDKRPQQEKDNYWLIPKDTFITNEQGEKMRDYWRIPKRESSKWIANMTESALNFAQKRDAKTFANFSQKMIEDISPVNIQGDTAQERLESVAASLNPVIKGPLELATGRDMYRHRDLLGDTLKKASPEQQYTDRTAEAFKVFAEKMPDIMPDVLRSPIMLENMTRNVTAGLLTQFLSRKPVEGRSPIENAALLQRFQAIPYTDNEEFTKQMKALERESADEYLKRNRTAQKILDENKGKPLTELVGKAMDDPKVMKQVVDLWMAKENGATSQDRRLIALPAKQRAQYIAKMLKAMSPTEQEQAIFDLSRKRVLTESVFQEMALLPQ